MNRVEVAIQEGRCVLVFGARALSDPEALGELRRRAAIPAIVLGTDIPAPAVALSAEALAPAIGRDSGVIVLFEADSADGAALNALAAIIAAAPHKPRLVVAARAFNPFLLPTPLRLLKFEHEKKRSKELLFTLPVPAPVATVAAAVAEEPKKKTGGAPRAVFVGREEELAALGELLGKGGPIVVSGPMGVGKRWLLEQALVGSAYTRLPDFHVGWGSEADSLYARIAMAGQLAGDMRLVDALKDPNNRPAPVELAQIAVAVLANPVMADRVMVIDRLEHVLRRDGTFHREGRFELLLRALLLAEGGARIVFLSTIRPRFYREGEGLTLGALELAGLKGRELHEIFDAYRVEDFPRDHFGDIQNRIHGHPMAARMFAIAVREAPDREELLAKKSFFQMDTIGDVEPIRRRIQKAVEHLTEEERIALGMLAHFRMPYTSADAEIVEVTRNVRLALQARGLLDQLPDAVGERTWHVHPLVNSVLGHRETSDFRLLEALGDHYLGRATKAEGMQKLALAQEGNRLLFEAHRVRNRMRIPYPDNDPVLESVRGLIRSKKARPDLAEQRLVEVLKQDPANTELQLLKAELMVGLKAPVEPIQEVYATAQALGPTPEAFHTEASWHQLKGTSGRGRAAGALERGAAVFPENARLKRRLAGIYLDQNRAEDAVTVLKEAMDLEPMMPDTYGLLGEIYLRQGASHFDLAEAALGEARRLDPDNALHMARLGALLVERGGEDEERAKQADDLLSAAIAADAKNMLAHVYLARLVLARNGDLERADWALKKAQKLDEKASLPLVLRARIAIRRQAWAEAATLLEKAVRLEPASHEAFFVRGELAEAQGQLFAALPEYQRAVERSPKDSSARPRYDDAVARVRTLIESGAYSEVIKAAEGTAVIAPPVGGARREPGKTTQRRRRRGGRGGAEGAEGAEAGAEGSEGAEAGLDGVDAAEGVEAAEAIEPDLLMDAEAGGESGGDDDVVVVPPLADVGPVDADPVDASPEDAAPVEVVAADEDRA
ncbi:MAG: tetratricopeptide repeat protein [Pseudomonadota bacterium]|nr:tetratricopeptide repeat protein [Pseudomonadota bacterium]